MTGVLPVRKLPAHSPLTPYLQTVPMKPKAAKSPAVFNLGRFSGDAAAA
jgi:hypothetical protein